MTHPITPPPELVEQWFEEASKLDTPTRCHIATRAAQWGADQELEECREWLNNEDRGFWGCRLHAARRPKPPSLKQQALAAQQRMWDGGSTHEDWQLIRRALEALPE